MANVDDIWFPIRDKINLDYDKRPRLVSALPNPNGAEEFETVIYNGQFYRMVDGQWTTTQCGYDDMVMP